MSRKFLAVVAALALAACVTAPKGSEPITLAERFELAAFVEDNGDETEGLFRWEQPYLVKVNQTGAPLPSIAPQLSTITELTGLEARRVQSGQTVDVNYATIDEILPYAQNLGRFLGWRANRQMTCFAWIERVRGGFWARVFIRNDLGDEHVNACLWQEMTQALGLGGDLDRPDSVFASGRS